MEKASTERESGKRKYSSRGLKTQVRKM